MTFLLPVYAYTDTFNISGAAFRSLHNPFPTLNSCLFSVRDSEYQTSSFHCLQVYLVWPQYALRFSPCAYQGAFSSLLIYFKPLPADDD